MAESPPTTFSPVMAGTASLRSSRRAAGASTYGALGFLILGAAALSLFFGSGDVSNPFGPISDVLFVGVAILLVPPVRAVQQLVDGRAGRWFDLVSWLAIAGLVVSGGGQVLLIAGLIPLGVSFVTFGSGLALFLLWGVALWAPAVRLGILPASVARWAVLSVAALLMATVGWFGFPPEVGYAAAGFLGLAMIAWLLSLGRALRRVA